jgi:hypothetical protein
LKLQKNIISDCQKRTAIRFDFKNNEGVLTLTTPGGKQELSISLDEQYRFNNKISDVPVGYKGRWDESSPLFIMDWIYLGEPYKCQGLFTFKEDNVRISITITPTGQSEFVSGKVVGE